MPYTLAILEVKDYARWKAAFDAFDAARRKVGEGAFQVFRSADDPHQVIVLIEWEDLDVARAAMKREELQKVLVEAGVKMPPTILFLHETESGVA